MPRHDHRIMLIFPTFYFASVFEEGELFFGIATTYHEITTFPAPAEHITWVSVVKRERLSLVNGSGPLCHATVGVASKSKADVAFVFGVVFHGVFYYSLTEVEPLPWSKRAHV